MDADGRLPVIVTDAQATYRLAGELLGRDLQQLTGFSATRTDRLDDCRERCIVIRAIGSALVTQVAQAMGVDLAPLAGQQERYIREAG